MSWFKDVLHQPDNRIRVVGVIPNPRDHVALSAIGVHAHWDLRLVQSCDGAAGVLKRREADVIICDRDLPAWDWREAIEFLRAHAPGARIIISSPANDDRFWLEVMERGGYDVLTRPFQEPRVVQTVQLAANEITK